MNYEKFLVDEFSPISLYSKIKDIFPDEKLFLFESVINNRDGNFSYIIVGEKESLVYKNRKTHYTKEGKKEVLDTDPFTFLKEYYKKIDFDHYRDLTKKLKIGFVDGFVGYIGYDMVSEFEPVLKKSMESLKDTTDIPDFYMVRPKVIIGYSHKLSEMTVIANEDKCEHMLKVIKEAVFAPYTHRPLEKASIIKSPEFVLSEEDFYKKIESAKEKIRSGDIFQIVLSNRLNIKAKVDNFSFYRKLRTKNPSPYLFFLDLGEFSIVGSSPEVMVRLTDNIILLRPIAGTRKRGKDLRKDIALEKEMLADEKEVAEHIMLVDLGRNDVGRVSKPGTVKVNGLMHVEKYSHVMHMVSDVNAEINEKYDMFDLFKATFTAGTMTGSPKIRAMELIAEFEGLKRGYYSGSIGYFGFDGNMDSAITIRTALIKDDDVIFQAGAGIVADSKPDMEFLEVNNKLGALVATLKELSHDEEF